MSLGFGKKTPDEYTKLQSMGDDLLPPADYVLQFDTWRHWQNSNAQKPSIYFLGLKTTAENDVGEGKGVSVVFRYHPNPSIVADKDYAKMNQSTEADLKDWIESANADVMMVDGATDMVATMEMLCQTVKPKIVCTLGQETYDGKTRNTFGKPKALGSA
jgi:hypothetical protein